MVANRGSLLRWLLKASFNSVRVTHDPDEQVESHRECRHFILGESQHPPFAIDLLVMLVPVERLSQTDA